MDLFVVRHAVAEDHAPDGDDAGRPLTKDGARRFRAVRRGLATQDVRFARILHSPWTRAAATAALLRKLVDDDRRIATELLCQAPRAELLALIAEDGGGGATAVVGHEPWLGELVAWLAFGDTRHGEAIPLKKGGVVHLTGRAVPGGMKLVAVMPPKLLRQLGA
jgi:phosphohistidine phosphatase